MSVPRLRMFAGPNGSGKSTIKSVVPERLLGVYLNPDEIQKDIEDRGFLNVQDDTRGDPAVLCELDIAPESGDGRGGELSALHRRQAELP